MPQPGVGLGGADGEGGVTHPESGVAPLLAVPTRTSPVLHEEEGQVGLRFGQILGVEGTEQGVGGHPHVEAFDQVVEEGLPAPPLERRPCPQAVLGTAGTGPLYPLGAARTATAARAATAVRAGFIDGNPGSAGNRVRAVRCHTPTVGRPRIASDQRTTNPTSSQTHAAKGVLVFEWSEEQLMVRDAVRRFIEAEVVPNIDALEYGDMAPYEIIRKLYATFGMDQLARDRFKAQLSRKVADGTGQDATTKATEKATAEKARRTERRPLR